MPKLLPTVAVTTTWRLYRTDLADRVDTLVGAASE